MGNYFGADTTSSRPRAAPKGAGDAISFMGPLPSSKGFIGTPVDARSGIGSCLEATTQHPHPLITRPPLCYILFLNLGELVSGVGGSGLGGGDY